MPCPPRLIPNRSAINGAQSGLGKDLRSPPLTHSEDAIPGFPFDNVGGDCGFRPQSLILGLSKQRRLLYLETGRIGSRGLSDSLECLSSGRSCCGLGEGGKVVQTTDATCLILEIVTLGLIKGQVCDLKKPRARDTQNTDEEKAKSGPPPTASDLT